MCDGHVPKTFAGVCEMVSQGHSGSQDAPDDPVNRLYRKHLSRHKPHLMPGLTHLSEETVAIAAEHWSVEDLVDLLPGGPVHKTPRKNTNDPLVIVRDRGETSIIDGGRRISAWARQGDKGPHCVAVLEVREE